MLSEVSAGAERETGYGRGRGTLVDVRGGLGNPAIAKRARAPVPGKPGLDATSAVGRNGGALSFRSRCAQGGQHWRAACGSRRVRPRPGAWGERKEGLGEASGKGRRAKRKRAVGKNGLVQNPYTTKAGKSQQYEG